MIPASQPPAPRSPLSCEDWQALLARELAIDVRVVFTRARRTPISVRTQRRPSKSYEVRLHGMFASAPDTIPLAVAQWIRSGQRARAACRELDRWGRRGLEALPRPQLAQSDVATRGEHHDLDTMRGELLAGELADDFRDSGAGPLVAWGRGSRRMRHSLRLGSYDADLRIARIHPVLDQAAVPDWFVRYVVFHELLHAALPPKQGKGSRWVHHGAEFRRRERAYADYARAIAWEDANIDALIRSARRGSPLPLPKLGAEKQPARPRRAIARLLQGWLFVD